MRVSEADAKAAYDATLQLMLGVTEYFFKQKTIINEIIFVSISILSRILRTHDAIWPAPGSADTELGVLMEPEVCHGETEVYTRVQA